MSDRITGTKEKEVEGYATQIFNGIFAGKHENGAILLFKAFLPDGTIRDIIIHKSEIYRLITSRVKQALTK